MAKPDDIFDRDYEWGVLESSWTKNRPELLFALGRRRVGKSHLLTRFVREVGGIYYQATRRSDVEQRAGLTQVLAEHFGDVALASASFDTWDALLDYLTAKMAEEPLLLVLDEFPYLTDTSPGLTSVLQRYWDHDWQGSRIRLVLCGSYITAMRQLEAADQPLYGRRTARLHVKPFTGTDVAAFVPSWPSRDQMLLYGIVGNLPGHLALVDEDSTLADNVADLMLDPNARLSDEAQHLIDAFVPHADVHYALIEAVANGDRTWSRITSRVGKSGGSVSRPLEWLEEMEILQRVVPISEKNPRRSKRAVYRVQDPYLAFWHRVLSPLHRAGTIGLASAGDIWTRFVEPRLDDYMGSVFEQICRDWIAQKGRPFAPVRLGAWWDAKSQNEVDIVAVSSEDELFVAECKWGAVTGEHLQTLRERSRLVAAELSSVSTVRLGLFSGRGEADETVRSAVEQGDVELFTPDDLFSS